MPRLTTKQYLLDRHWLVTLWQDRRQAFGSGLSPREQWDVHAIFAPAEDLDDAQAIEHRERAVERDPSLPQRAGRAIKKLRAEDELLHMIMVNMAAHHQPGAKRPKRGPVVVTAIAKPRIDPEDISSALQRIMWDIQQEYLRKS